MDIEAQTRCFTTQLIKRDGTFNEHGLDNFIKQVNLGECGLSYAIVAVMGPQSSGKSTLLNHLFQTNFREMDSSERRGQTTEGIWIARCTSIHEPCTIVMDVEGTDGRERGEDNTLFERQSALFAIAVADITLINMWCNDIGRVNAANTPLLKIVFQVLLQIGRSRGKTTLMFVIRDKPEKNFEILVQSLKTDIKTVWDSVPKAEAHKHTQLSDFFNVQIIGLSNYQEKEAKFKQQVAVMREKFSRSIEPGGLAGDRQGVVPASGLSISTQAIWKVIKENKNLDLPSVRVMTANVRCKEIAKDIYSSFACNQDWVKLSEAVKSDLVPSFREKLGSLLCNCWSSYDEQVKYYDEKVRSDILEKLKKNLKQLVQPAFKSMLEHIRSKTLEKFKDELNDSLKGGKGFEVAARDCTEKSMRLFDEQCEDATSKQANLDYTKIRDKLSNDLATYITEVRKAKLEELTTLHKSKFKQALSCQVKALVEQGSDDTWPEVRKLLRRETARGIYEFSSALSSVEIVEQEKQDMISKLKNYGRQLVEQKAREEAEKVSYRMKERFEAIFCHGDDSKPRNWTDDYSDIPALAETAQSSSLKLLSVLAAIRLDGDTDTIWNTLKEGIKKSPYMLASSSWKGINTSPHLLDLDSWEEVPETMTLITPVKCKSLWYTFEGETNDIINNATTVQIMTATVKCEEIAKDIYSSFVSNQDWAKLSKAAKYDLVPGFGEKLSSLLSSCLSNYEEQVKNYDEDVRSARIEQLKANLTQLVQPAFQLMLERIRFKTLEKFKGELNDSLKGGNGFEVAARDCTEKLMRLFDEQCEDATSKQANLDSTEIRDTFSHDFATHITEVRAAKLKDLTTLYRRPGEATPPPPAAPYFVQSCEGFKKSKFKESLCSPVKAHLERGSDDTWPRVRALFLHEAETVIYKFSSALSSFEIVEQEKEDMISKLKNYGRRLIEDKASEVAANVFYLMKERFEVIFSHGDESKPRNWTGEEDIPDIIDNAYISSLKLLSVLAAIRLDGDTDTIWYTLKEGINTSSHLFYSSSWEEVPATMTLITPVQCKSLWDRFKGETKSIITQATTAQVMMANVRCEEIASDIYSYFATNQDWVKLRETVKSHLVPYFGEKLSSLLCNCLSKYEEQVKNFDEKVGSATREQLKEKLTQLVQPVYQLLLEHIRSKTLEKFKGELNDSLNGGKGFEVAARHCTENSMRLFDEQCEDATCKQANLDYTEIRDKFSHDLATHIIEVRAAKLKELTTLHKSKFKEALCSPVKAHLERGSDDTWPRVRALFLHEAETVIYKFSSALSSFEIVEQEKQDMISKLKNYGRRLIEDKANEVAANVFYLMKERFEVIFSHGDESKPRNWTGEEDIPDIIDNAYISSLKLLSVLAAIRLDGDTDTIWYTLKEGINTSSHLFYSSSWEEVPATMTLITPVQCKSLWDRFKGETKSIITQATTAQKGLMQAKKFDPLANKGVRHVASAAGIVAGGAVGLAMLVAASVATVASTHVVGGAGLAALLASPPFVVSTASKAKHFVEGKLNKRWKKDDGSEK